MILFSQLFNFRSVALWEFFCFQYCFTVCYIQLHKCKTFNNSNPFLNKPQLLIKKLNAVFVSFSNNITCISDQEMEEDERASWVT